MESVEWGEYRVGDLFDIVNTPSFNKERLTAGDEYDYVTRTSLNQGILQGTGFVNESNLNEANVWSLGLLQMDFFYRKRKWYAGQFVRKIIPKFETTANNAKFFSVMLNKLKPVLLQVLVRNVDDTFKNQLLNLPTQNNQIDFDFMESFIAELEAERIAELSAYLKVSGLDNYELSIEERNALRAYNSMEWREYKLGELFEVKTYKKRFDANKVALVSKGGNPYVVRKSTENGIKGFISEDDSYLNEGNTISFGQDTATSFYQEQPYFTGDKIKILEAKFNGFNKENAQFFVSAITRSFSKFSWGSSSYSVDIISNQKLALPVLNNEIDIKYIEIISKAISKLAIKDVVQYTDKRIEATKTVVAEHQKEESE